MSACQKREDQSLVTIDGENITVQDFIQENSHNLQLRAQLIEQIIDKVALDTYGKDVNTKDIEYTYEETKHSYGESFAQVLVQEGLTETTLKNKIKAELALNEAVKAMTNISQAEREQAWQTYHPTVKAQIAVFESKEQAEKAIAASKNQPNISSYAKQSAALVDGADAEGILSFDSESEAIPENVKQSAFELKKDERSTVLTGVVQNGLVNQTQYYVIQMLTPSDPNKKLEDYQTELDQSILDKKVKDEVVRSEVIQKLLSQADVKIVDEDFAGILDNYHLEQQQSQKWWEKITSIWK